MRRASFLGTQFLSGIAVGAGMIAGALGLIKLHAVCRKETTTDPETQGPSEPEAPPVQVPGKKPRARRTKAATTPARKSSEHESHRAKSWKN